MKNRFLLFATVFMASNAMAGAVIEVKTTEYHTDPPILGAVKMTTRGESSRLEVLSVSSSEAGALIFNGELGEMIAVDYENRQFVRMNQAQVNALAAQVENALKEMEATLAAMPPEQQAFERQMMESQAPSSSPKAGTGEMVSAGKSDVFAGHECQWYDLIDEGQKIRDVCITAWEDFPEGEQVATALHSLSDFFEQMREAFSAAGGMAAMDRQQDMFKHMKELGGYPIRSRDYDEEGKVVLDSELVSAGPVDVQDAAFAAPEGFTEQVLPTAP